MGKLYLVQVCNTDVGENYRYHVYCTADEISAWVAMLAENGHPNSVVYTEQHLSDLDEINHNHFC